MLSNATAGYDAHCEATHPSDACPLCGIDCRCSGPHELDDSAISAARSASPLSQLTTAIGRTDDRDVEVVELPTRSKRIPADPRLAAIADQLAESILATLAAHGYAIVREADTQGYSAERNEEFAREAARNAVVIAAMEGVL